AGLLDLPLDATTLLLFKNRTNAAVAAQGRTEANRSHRSTTARQFSVSELGSQPRTVALIDAVPGSVTEVQVSKASTPATLKPKPAPRPTDTVTATLTKI